jgi:hypothetical protein
VVGEALVVHTQGRRVGDLGSGCVAARRLGEDAGRTVLRMGLFCCVPGTGAERLLEIWCRLRSTSAARALESVGRVGRTGRHVFAQVFRSVRARRVLLRCRPSSPVPDATVCASW